MLALLVGADPVPRGGGNRAGHGPAPGRELTSASSQRVCRSLYAISAGQRPLRRVTTPGIGEVVYSSLLPKQCDCLSHCFWRRVLLPALGRRVGADRAAQQVAGGQQGARGRLDEVALGFDVAAREPAGYLVCFPGHRLHAIYRLDALVQADPPVHQATDRQVTLTGTRRFFLRGTRRPRISSVLARSWALTYIAEPWLQPWALHRGGELHATAYIRQPR